MKKSSWKLLLLFITTHIECVFALSNSIPLCEKTDILKAIKIIGIALNTIVIIVPILLIFNAIISLVKIILENLEVKDAINNLIKKTIIGAMIIFLPTIIFSITDLIKKDDTNIKFINCSTILLKPLSDKSKKIIDDAEKKEILLLQEEDKSKAKQNNTDQNSSQSVKTIRNSKYTASRDYVEDKELIKKMEGYSDCDNGNGYQVFHDQIAEANYGGIVPASAYGITWAQDTLINCNLITDEESNNYFVESKFIPGACIPKEVYDRAMNCFLEDKHITLHNFFSRFCNQKINLNSYQELALIDQLNSGVGHSQSVVKAFCNNYNSNNNFNQAVDAMFKEIFSRNRMNPACSYEARRDCEARIFFDNDTSCVSNIYNPNYEYKYGKYLDTNYFSLVNNKCVAK